MSLRSRGAIHGVGGTGFPGEVGTQSAGGHGDGASVALMERPLEGSAL